MPIWYMFCFICKERCIKINSSRNKCGLYSSAFKKFIPNNKTPSFQEWWGNLTPQILSMAQEILIVLR